MVDLTDTYVNKDWFIPDGEDSKGNPKKKRISPNLAFLMNEINDFDTFVFQGATRSGKTYAILMYIWNFIDNYYPDISVTVVRQSMPVLKGTVIPDFIDIGKMAGLYDKSNHNLTDQIYTHKGNTVSFVAAENIEKLKGRKQDIVYFNEAPELSWGQVQQLLFRTTGKKFYDYNPSYPESWMYDNILTRDNVAFIKTTYQDNPFLSQAQIDEIEWMKINDPQQYVIYGLGERGESANQVYNNFRKIRDEHFPDREAKVWGVDFGFTQDPTAIAKSRFIDNKIYVKEIAYERGLQNYDIMILLWLNGYKDDEHTLIVDSANPQDISVMRNGIDLKDDFILNRIYQLGYEKPTDEEFASLRKFMQGITVYGAIKPPGSILSGINKLRGYQVFAPQSSTSLWKEYSNYKWMVDRLTGKPINKPIDKHNHLLDLIRYKAICEGRYFFKEDSELIKFRNDEYVNLS